MKKIKDLEDIEVWKLSREQANLLWEKINKNSFAKDFALKDQVSRSSGSVMDNIAEGFGRGGNREFVHFLCISRGSNYELKSQLYRALDRYHINREEFEFLRNQSNTLGVKITNFITYLRKSDLKGQKFH